MKIRCDIGRVVLDGVQLAYPERLLLDAALRHELVAALTVAAREGRLGGSGSPTDRLHGLVLRLSAAPGGVEIGSALGRAVGQGVAAAPPAAGNLDAGVKPR
jgi:hypothetical protein